MRSTRKFSGRPCVGFVLASLHTGASLEAWPGALAEAERLGVDLLTFPGGRLGQASGYEASRNAVYELAAGAPLDGLLVWTSSICGPAAEASADSFLARFSGLPAVSLSAGASGMPVVTVDYYGGMLAAVRHARRDHGFRRVAYLRGPEGHAGAEERFRAFRDAMAELYDPALVSSPHTWDEGAEALEELVSGRSLRPGRDFEALVAASDLMAFWAARAVRSLGLGIPEDVALIGMNGSEESRLSSPPLTTAECPFGELGAEGLRSVCEAIGGRELPGLRTLPSRLAVRRSCGCPSPSFLRAAAPVGTAAAAATASELGLAEGTAREWLAPLEEAWRAAASGGPAKAFHGLLERILDRAARLGAPVSAWQDVVSELRLGSLPGLDAAGRDRAEALAGSARVLVAEAAERAEAAKAWERARRDGELRRLDHGLLMALDARRLGEELRAGLPPLGIRSAYVCRYEEGGRAARLVTGFRDGGSAIAPSGAFPTADLLPEGVLPSRRLSYVVEPLFFHESPIGYALFESGSGGGELYERLRDSVSSALRGLVLFGHEEESRAAAERADGVKTRLLTNVSHELRAPAELALKGTRRLLERGRDLAPELRSELERVAAAAALESRIVNDLMDLSRAELDELDLALERVDLAGDLSETFDLFASAAKPGVEWSLSLPARLPEVAADRQRIRQILVNLLSNAAKFTRSGRVALEARVGPEGLLVSVTDTGPGIAPSIRERLFEPFATSGEEGGTGLGLSIARHLAILHGGGLEAEDAEGGGTRFTLSLPLAPLPGAAASREQAEGELLLVVAAGGRISAEMRGLAEERGLSAVAYTGAEEGDGAGPPGRVRATAWDFRGLDEAELAAFRRLRQDPRLASLPLIVGGEAGAEAGAAILPKLREAGGLAEAMELLPRRAEGREGPVLVADDDEACLAELVEELRRIAPDAEIATARDGKEALRLARARTPRIALLDLVMPGMGGLELARRMREDEGLRRVPVVLLTSKAIGMEDVAAVEGLSRIVLKNKGVGDPAAGLLASGAARPAPLPPATSAIVKRGVAFLNAHYSRPIARWQLAEAAAANEDYLARIFRKELGMGPWEYLARLRVKRAEELLAGTGDSVAAVAEKVGFSDQAYFCRVFKRYAGTSPNAFRNRAR